MVRESDLLAVLVIQAHPDDADISSGGTIARWAREGRSITYIICTSGEAGSSKPQLPPSQLGPAREQEELEAAGVLGVGEVVFLRHPDGGLKDSPLLREQLIEAVLRLRPEVVMAHDCSPGRSRHPDHFNAGAAALAAVVTASQRGHRVEQVLLFQTGEPNTAFDISPTMDIKLAAIERHRTQRSIGHAPLEAISRWAKAAGERWGFEMAEAFKALTLEQCEALASGEIVPPSS